MGCEEEEDGRERGREVDERSEELEFERVKCEVTLAPCGSI